MHAVGTRGERHVDPIVDDEGDGDTARATALIARAISTMLPRVALFVAQLQERRPAFGDAARQIGEVAPAGALGIDNGVETQIERLHHGSVYGFLARPATDTSAIRDPARAGGHPE